MDLNRAVDIESLKKIADYLADRISMLYVHRDDFNSFCFFEYVPNSLRIYDKWIEDQSNTPLLKLAVTTLACTAEDAIKYYEPIDSVWVDSTGVKKVLQEYAELRNQPGYFLVHPQLGHVQLVASGDEIHYQRADQQSSTPGVSDCYDYPYSLFKFEHEGKTIFEVPGPTCFVQDAYLQYAMTDENPDNPLIQLRAASGAYPRNLPSCGYISLEFEHPEHIDEFLFGLDKHFQEWCSRMTNLGVMKKIFELNPHDVTANGSYDYAYLGINDREPSPSIEQERDIKRTARKPQDFSPQF